MTGFPDEGQTGRMIEELPESVVDVIEGITTEDSQRFLAAFTDDAVVDDWGRSFHGPAAIASWNRSDNLDRHTRVVVTGYARDGDRHVVAIDVSGGGFNGAGTFTFRLADDGRVARLDVT